MSDLDELYTRIGEAHAFAVLEKIEHLLIKVLVNHAVEAALSIGVADWHDSGEYPLQSRQEIAERLKEKIEDMLLVEVAKTNNT